MARAGIFQISLLCILSLVPGGGRAPLNSPCRFLFHQMAAHRTTYLPQRASLIGLLRKQPGKKGGGGLDD